MNVVKNEQTVLRRPRLAKRDMLLGTGVIAFLSLASAAIAAPMWLGLRAMGVSRAWIPLLVPCVVLLITLMVGLVLAWRRSRERVVIRPALRELELRHLVLGYRGMLFSASTSCTIPFAAIRAIETVYNGHMPPGTRLVLSEEHCDAGVIEIAYDEFDRGRVSAILAGVLGVTPMRASVPHH
jgi:hypothetical protein